MSHCTPTEHNEKNEIMSFAGKWTELEIITFSEIIRAQKPYSTFSLIGKIYT
jgi:hypothetical protein